MPEEEVVEEVESSNEEAVEVEPKTERVKTTDFKVPDEYKERGWASKVKSQEDLYKQIDTLDTLKGKKNVAFDFENATPEEINEHYSVNIPKEYKDYKIAETIHESNYEPIQKMLHEAKLDKWQGEQLTNSYVKWETERMEKAQNSDDWDAILKDMYKGEDHKKASGETANIISNNLNDMHKEVLNKEFTNRHLEVIYALAKNMAKSYGAKESDKGIGGEGGIVVDAEKGRSEIRTKLRELSSRPHTKDEHDALVKQLTSTYEKK